MNRIKIKAILFALISVSVLLSGCTSTNDLSGFLVPPQTTSKMKELKSDISEIAGNDITFLSSAKGNYRNTINFCDIDSDSEDEAIAIYAPQSGEKVAHILILKRSLGNWAQLINFTITGTSVDILSFIDYNGDGTKEIVIGLSSNVADSKGLSIYNVTGTEVKELLTLQYNAITITSTDEILTVSLDKTAGNTANLIKSENSVPKVVSTCPLYSLITSVGNIIFGNTEAGASFFISESLDLSNTLTEIIILENGQITNRTLSNNQLLFDTYLKRAGTPYIQDVDSDNLIEISKSVQIASTSKSSTEPMKLVEWFSFTGTALKHKIYTVINPNERYYIIIPNQWIGKVSAKAEQSASAITFYADDGNGNNTNLFSVYAMSQSEWENKEDKVNWSLIKKSNDRIYCLYIYDPQSQLSNLYSISASEIDKLFVQATLIQ